MSRRGRVLAIDPGEVSHGLALSDALGLTAQPLETLRCAGPRRDVERLAEIVRERDVTTIVVGLPLLMSGAEGERSRAARDLARALGERLPGVSIELWDERLTTVEAERTLIAGDVRRRRRRAVVDRIAAVLILQGFLDSRAAGEASRS